MMEICTRIQTDTGVKDIDVGILEDIHKRFAAWSDEGFRVLGIAWKPMESKKKYSIEDEKDMIFMGFLLFFDPLKPDVSQTITDLKTYGVQLRIITGDNKFLALHVANSVGLQARSLLTGSELAKLSEGALLGRIETIDLFAEMDPTRKNASSWHSRRKTMSLVIWETVSTTLLHCIRLMWEYQ